MTLFRAVADRQARVYNSAALGPRNGQAAAQGSARRRVVWTSLAFAVITGLVAWLYAPVFVNLVAQWWDDPNYSHGFLIPLISAYFVWERRKRLRRLTIRPVLTGLFLLVTGVGIYLLGHVAAELFTMRASLLVVLAGLVLYLLGSKHLKTLALPLLYLSLMIPLPQIVFNAVTFPLQLFAARVATAGLEHVGIPVLREGNLITLANTTLEVAEACSGIRSLMTLVALAVTYAYFTQSGFWRRGLLVLSAVPTAILANAARVAGTGVLTHLYGVQVAEGFFHTFSGWFVFAVAFGLLIGEGACVKRLFPAGGRGPSNKHERTGSVPLASVVKGEQSGQEVPSSAGS